MNSDPAEPGDAPRPQRRLWWALQNAAIFFGVEVATIFLALIAYREDEEPVEELAAAAVAFASWTWLVLLVGAVPYLVLVWLIARRRPLGRLAGVALSPVLGLPLTLTFLVGFGLEAIPWAAGATVVAGALLRLPPHAVRPHEGSNGGKRSQPEPHGNRGSARR